MMHDANLTTNWVKFKLLSGVNEPSGLHRKNTNKTLSVEIYNNVIKNILKNMIYLT